jgi:hypothetical protein
LEIAPAGAQGPAGYVGQRYRLSYTWNLTQFDWRELARWMLLHEAPPSATAQDAMLYVKQQVGSAAGR